MPDKSLHGRHRPRLALAGDRSKSMHAPVPCKTFSSSLDSAPAITFSTLSVEEIWCPSTAVTAINYTGATHVQQRQTVAHTVQQRQTVTHTVQQRQTVTHTVQQRQTVAHTVQQRQTVAHTMTYNDCVVGPIQEVCVVDRKFLSPSPSCDPSFNKWRQHIKQFKQEPDVVLHSAKQSLQPAALCVPTTHQHWFTPATRAQYGAPPQNINCSSQHVVAGSQKAPTDVNIQLPKQAKQLDESEEDEMRLTLFDSKLAQVDTDIDDDEQSPGKVVGEIVQESKYNIFTEEPFSDTIQRQFERCSKLDRLKLLANIMILELKGQSINVTKAITNFTLACSKTTLENVSNIRQFENDPLNTMSSDSRNFEEPYRNTKTERKIKFYVLESTILNPIRFISLPTSSDKGHQIKNDILTKQMRLLLSDPEHISEKFNMKLQKDRETITSDIKDTQHNYSDHNVMLDRLRTQLRSMITSLLHVYIYI